MTPRFMSPWRAVKRKNFQTILTLVFSIVCLKRYGYGANEKWDWQVFLPGVPNSIPHVVTSHTTAHHETKPFSTRSLQNLYKGSNTNIMFQRYAKAFKSSQSQEFLSKLNKSDSPEASTGFEFLTKVFRWMEQDLNKKLPTGYKFEDNKDRWRIDLSPQDNYTIWLLRHYNIDSTNRKSIPIYLLIWWLLNRWDGL